MPPLFRQAGSWSISPASCVACRLQLFSQHPYARVTCPHGQQCPQRHSPPRPPRRCRNPHSVLPAARLDSPFQMSLAANLVRLCPRTLNYRCRPLKNSHVCATLAQEVRSAMQATAQHECPRTKSPDDTPNLEPFFANSNRYNKLLELPVTCTKQMVAPISNRYRMPLVAQRASALISRNASLAVAVKTRGDWHRGARAVTIQTQMNPEMTI